MSHWHIVIPDRRIVGYALSSARGDKGEPCPIQARGMVTSEDGDLFLNLLDQFSRGFLARVPGFDIAEHKVYAMVALLGLDGGCDIYVNDVSVSAQVVAAMDVKADSPASRDQIAEIVSMELEGIPVPPEKGVFVMIPFGWRRGILFDYRPMLPGGGPRRKGEFERDLAGLYQHLLFQDRHRHLSNPSVWRALRRSGWFPFLCLSDSLVEKLIQSALAGWDVDEHLDAVVDEVREKHAPAVLRLLEGDGPLAGHREYFRLAVGHFQSGDFISANAIFYTRIEGLLRDRYYTVSANSTKKPSEGDLAAVVAGGVDQVAKADVELLPPLAPRRFTEFLRNTYFRNFSNSSGRSVVVSRHSVAYGVSTSDPVENKKAAVVAVLSLHQLAFLLRDR